MLQAPNAARVERHEENDADAVDLKVLIGTIWRGKLWVALAVAVAVLIGAYYAFVAATPIYRASAVVILDTREEQVVGLDSVLGGLTGDTSVVNTEVEVLRGRGLMEQVVQKLNLTSDPEFNTQLRPLGAMARVKGAIKSLLPSGPTITLNAQEEQRRVLDNTVSNLLGAMSVRNVPQSLVFEITAETEDPKKSALIADTIADLYILDQLKVKFDATEQATEWLSDRVTELQGELEAAEARLQQFRSATELIDPAALEALQTQVKDTRERISNSEIQFASLRQRADALAAARGRAEQAAAADDAVLNRLLPTLETDPTAAGTFDTRFEQLAARAQIEATRSNDQLTALRASLSEMEARAERQSQDLITLQQYTREAESSRLIYEYFLSRLKETSVQQGVQQADSRILSRAVLPSFAAEPRKSLVLVMSAILGMMVGIGAVLLREMMQSTFRSARDLERVSGRSVMGQIPLIPVRTRRDALGYLAEKPTSAAAEAVRNLRTSVLHSNIDVRPQVIMTSSALPGEGKTTTALALAQNFTQMGRKVLIVEGDIRRRVFGMYFQIKNEHGLLSVLAGDHTLEETVHNDPRIGDILIGEPSKTNAADIFSSEAFMAFVRKVRSIYDIVIIDTPPVLVVPDARVIGQHADAILFVVKWDSTSQSQVVDALHMFETVNLRVTGMVLSQISEKGMKRYGYGGRYGAYSAYGKKYYVD